MFRFNPLPLHLLVAALLCVQCVVARAQSGDASEFKDGAWVSYRDSYRKMIGFEKYGGPKQYLQNNIRVSVIDKKSTLDGVKLALEGRKTHLILPLDPVGRAVFPMLKSAYDDNAELRVNRPDSVVKIEYRLSIVTRPDGVYDIGELRSACEQALQFLRYQDTLYYSLKKCVGVAFSYAKEQGDSVLRVNAPDQSSVLLPVADGSVFADDGFAAFKVAQFKFAVAPEKGQVMSYNVPLAITALFANIVSF
jgi:hypothetical protein